MPKLLSLRTAPTWRGAVQSGFERLCRAVPSQCAVCHAWPAQPVCDSCIGRFAQPRTRCETCALPVPAGVLRCGACLSSPPPIDLCLAVLDYDYPWRGLITRYKFQPEPGWAGPLADLARSMPWVEPALEAADVVLPMPLSRQRLQERGFNQALAWARRLAPDKIHADWLLRLHHTPAQSTLPRAQRLHNVQQAFTLAPSHAAKLRQCRVVLVDDVMTSGASVTAAATVLRQAGVAHITALVLARTA